MTEIVAGATGGSAKIVTTGSAAGGSGVFDISQSLLPGLTVGSIEGSGNYRLGSKVLTFGSLNTNTSLSGVISDSGIGGGSGGSIVKVGNGTTTLAGLNTYTGTTTVDAGALTVSGSIGSNSLATVNGGGTLNFAGSASAGDAPITVVGGAAPIESPSGLLEFHDSSSAGHATITVNGGAAVNAPNGTAIFRDNSTAHLATIITNGGVSGGFGGITEFADQATGGSARVVTNAGGVFDISQETNPFGFTPNVIFGSIEGDGTYQLGGNTLTFGGLGTNTTVSGAITDGGIAGGTGGSIVKTGSGATTLGGTNTYTGTTSVNAGTLFINGSIATSHQTTVNSGGTLDFVGVANTGGITNNGNVAFSGGPTIVDGDVVNNGTFVTTGATVSFNGTFTNDGIYRSDPSTQNYQNLTLGPNGALLGDMGDIFNVRGNLINNSTLAAVWDTHLSQIGFNASGAHQLAWTGTEQGRGNAGFVDNFAVGIFALPSGAVAHDVGRRSVCPSSPAGRRCFPTQLDHRLAVEHPLQPRVAAKRLPWFSDLLAAQWLGLVARRRPGRRQCRLEWNHGQLVGCNPLVRRRHPFESIQCGDALRRDNQLRNGNARSIDRLHPKVEPRQRRRARAPRTASRRGTHSPGAPPATTIRRPSAAGPS